MKFMMFVIMLLVGFLVFFPSNEKDLSNQLVLESIKKCDAKSKEIITKIMENKVFSLNCANDSTIEVDEDVYNTIPVKDITIEKSFWEVVFYYGVPFGMVFSALCVLYYVIRRFR
ncbi:TPA: hypothetical protein ACS8CE_003456 [Providencia alcalifaciens]